MIARALAPSVLAFALLAGTAAAAGSPPGGPASAAGSPTSIDVDAEAKRLFEAGGQAYDQARYLIAIDAFEAAHKLSPRAVTAFSAAQAHRLQYFVDLDPRHLERAIALYRAYLDLAPDGNRRDHASQHLATLVPILERLRREGGTEAGGKPASSTSPRVIVSTRPADATVRIDGGEPEAAPASFEVAPGRHRIDVAAPEYVAQTLETVAVAGSVVALNVALEPQPGLVDVKAPPGARVSVDGQVAGSAPLPRPVEVRPGHHTVAVTARGRRPFVREVDVGRGQRLSIESRLQWTAQRWAAVAFFAAGGALVAGTAAVVALAYQRQGDAETYVALTQSGMSLTVPQQQRYTMLVGQRNQLVDAGITTGALAVAAGVTGLVLWIFDRPEAPPAVVAPLVGDHAAGVSVGGRF